MGWPSLYLPWHSWAPRPPASSFVGLLGSSQSCSLISPLALSSPQILLCAHHLPQTTSCPSRDPDHCGLLNPNVLKAKPNPARWLLSGPSQAKVSILESKSLEPDGILTLTLFLPNSYESISQKTDWQIGILMCFKNIFPSLSPYCAPGTGLGISYNSSLRGDLIKSHFYR